jgi:hypothetical protein
MRGMPDTKSPPREYDGNWMECFNDRPVMGVRKRS